MPAAEPMLTLESAGVRLGASANHSGSDFKQVEAFLNLNLPWHWPVGKGWLIQSRLDTSAGWLGDGENGGVFTIGPSFLLKRERFPVYFDLGLSPTGLTQHEFVHKDFGIELQFTTHVGVNLELSPKLRLGYRFQHMSNAHISGHNPGLNLHMFSLEFPL